LEVTQEKTYRNDIEGLRAIAVLSVVLFHIDKTWMPGGFVGVDVFFVISGFLITRYIMGDLQTGRFRFKEFYRRRILRIIPVMIFVVALTLVAGVFILLPDDLTRLASSSIAAVFSAANVYFTYFLDTSYFADDSVKEPLLHLWSLGVEEQFYLFYPLLVVFAYRFFGRLGVIAFALLITLLSFWYAQTNVISDVKFAYYMLPARAGELLLGALSVFAVDWLGRNQLDRTDLIHAATWLVGALLLGSSIFLLSEEIAFPGYAALPPTLGAALLIIGGSKGTALATPLTWQPACFFGRISYSMYLWHWPILAYARYINPELSLFQKLSALLVITILSVCSFYGIEERFRRSDKPLSRVFSAYLLTQGFVPFGSTDYKTQLAEVTQLPAGTQSYVCQHYDVTDELLSRAECQFGSPDHSSTLVWGDSNAAHFVGMFAEILAGEQIAFRNVSHSSCPPLTNLPGRFAGRPELAERCNQSLLNTLPLIASHETLIIAGAWGSYLRKPGFFNELQNTLSALVAQQKRVFLIGVVPRFRRLDRECNLKAIKLNFLECPPASRVSQKRHSATNEKLQNMAGQFEAVTYLDIDKALCDGEYCSSKLEDSLVYFDRSHLSVSGSIKIGRTLGITEFAEAFTGIAKDPNFTKADLPWYRQPPS